MFVGEEKRSLGIGGLSLLNCAPIGHNGVRYALEGEAFGKTSFRESMETLFDLGRLVII